MTRYLMRMATADMTVKSSEPIRISKVRPWPSLWKSWWT